MYDDDRDALAAEYVLGTLSADERDQAEALLAIDPGFAEIVRMWERRLGELNVMVEAVEPPPDVWDKIRDEVGIAAPRGTGEVETGAPLFTEAAPLTAPEATPEIMTETPPAPAPEIEPTPQPALDLPSELMRDLNAQNLDPDNLDIQDQVAQDLDAAMPTRDTGDAAAVAALASSLLPPEAQAETLSPPAPVGRSADIIRLQRRVRRWRGFTVAMSAIAALLAVFVAVTQFVPGLIPSLGRLSQSEVAVRPPPPGSRLVAVLQQEPTSPAFLLTLDPQSRTYTVRTVSATPEAGRSYQLWLLADKSQGPRSLGLVGGEEFTTRPLPAGFDVAMMQGAEYAISLEPAGGSPSGAPTGPILFTGKMVESLPGSPS